MKNSLKLSLIFIFSIGMISTSNAQKWKGEKGNGNITTVTKTTSDYNTVKVVGFMDVELVSGNEGNITVTTDENIQKFVSVESVNNVLTIKIKKHTGSIRTKKGIHITVPFRDLSNVSLTGSGDVFSNDTIKSTHFTTIVTGSGDLELQIEAQSTVAKITGSGDLKLSGTTQNSEIEVHGSGDFIGENLISENTEVTVTGSGDALVTATNSIKARVNGSGDISYTGNPKTSNIKTLGSGDIIAH